MKRTRSATNNSRGEYQQESKKKRISYKEESDSEEEEKEKQESESEDDEKDDDYREDQENSNSSDSDDDDENTPSNRQQRRAFEEEEEEEEWQEESDADAGAHIMTHNAICQLKPGKKNMELILNNKEAIVNYYPGFLDAFESFALFTVLKKKVPWRKEIIKRPFGKGMTEAKRTTFSYGDGCLEYSYAGKKEVSAEWIPELMPLKNLVEHVLGCKYNFALLNYYKDGNDCIGAHSDSEPDLVPGHTIASISLGAERHFVLQHKHRKGKESKHVILLQNGSMITMGGNCQEFYKHSVPTRKRVQTPRINITFRMVDTSFSGGKKKTKKQKSTAKKQ